MAGKAEKVLIIVYYWPPSGGSGVQRWVKLTKYLSAMGCEVHVLTVDEKYASYMQLDTSLQSEIPGEIFVHKTRSFEIINLFARIFGRKKVPTAGFYNLDRKSLVHYFGMMIRSNLFIPDPRRGWNRFAYRKALEIIRKEKIQTIITSSPPHSSQLIGLKLKKKTGINWIADLRDPWTDIFYYKILKHSFLSKRIDASYEKKVLVGADKILTVSQHLKDLLTSKDPGINPDKVILVPNGYDEEDFQHIIPSPDPSRIKIGYTGTLSDQYEPQFFLKAFARVAILEPSLRLELTGTISPGIKSFIASLGIPDQIVILPPVDHRRIPEILQSYQALLLLIPKVEHAGLILTGKLFEYLAAKKHILMAGPVDGDAAKIITDCNSGVVFDWADEESMFRHLKQWVSLLKKGEFQQPDGASIIKYSRQAQAKKVAEAIQSLQSNI